MQVWKRAIFIIVLCTAVIYYYAQNINDSLLTKIAKRFEQAQHLSLQQIIQTTVLSSGKIPEENLPCYSGMQVTIVALFSRKPEAAYGRMLVTKHYSTSTQFDEHLFQQAAYDEAFKVNYTLLSVYFPPEATYKNCNTMLQVYDKKKPDNKVWLIILTK
jgi:hypothetical protein